MAIFTEKCPHICFDTSYAAYKTDTNPEEKKLEKDINWTIELNHNANFRFQNIRKKPLQHFVSLTLS